MAKFYEYSGMTYRQASIEGARLIMKAHHTGEWHSIVERLAELKAIMIMMKSIEAPKTLARGIAI